MMYRIDLLEGRGLPPKSRPGKTAATAAGMTAPFLLLAGLAAIWMQNRTIISAQAKACQQYERQIQAYEKDLTQYDHKQQQITQLQSDLEQISQSLQFEIQISPILKVLAETLPESLCFNKVDLKFTPGREKITTTENQAGSFVPVAYRNLNLTVIGPNQAQTDQAVKDYIEQLRKQPNLNRCFQDIRIASRQQMVFNEQERFTYEIECVFFEQKGQ